MEFYESEVIGACALRMDGYKYIEETGLDVDEALDYFFRTGNWNISLIEQMAVFFIIQRAFRQPLEYEPKNGRYWRAFRELFLKLCDQDVPEKYRHAIYEEWEQKYAPHLAEYVRRVERIHKTIRYDDCASVTNRLRSKD
jgi:8-oxo-dGTP pyrophosphatase MutT (NUDIX family)